MSCLSCGNKRTIEITTRVELNKNIFPKTENLIGTRILTTLGRVGTVTGTNVNSYEEVVGYILKDDAGDRFTIFKNQFLDCT